MGTLIMPKPEAAVPIGVVAYASDLVKRVIAIANTRDLFEQRTPAQWGQLFRSEMEQLNG